MSGQRRAPGKAVTRKPKRPGTTKRRVLTALKWLLVVGLVGALLGALTLFVVYQRTDIPDPNAEFLTQTTKVYYADGETELGSFAVQDRESIPLDDMPQTLQDAVVAAEDQTYWTNRGIDPKGILRAFWNNLRGNPTQGASTITQQYVKILYLTSERSLQRKVSEAMVSLKLQRDQSKREILEGYLNTIYFGRGAYGVEAASRAYFDKSARDIDLKEAAALAAILNDPNDLDPANGKKAKRELKGRYQYVLDSMAEMDTADPARVDKARKRLPAFPEQSADSKYGGMKGHMLTLVRKELNSLGYSDQEIDGGGLRITTTFDPKAMSDIAAAVKQVRPGTGFDGQRITDQELHVGVAAVEPGTGALRGFYGGQDYLKSQINWAATGGMVGSTMKAVTLATAITEGFSLKDTFEGNSPYEFPDGLEVNNEGTGPDGLGNDYGSAVSAITATEESINTAYVDMSASMEDGPQKIYDMGRSMGIPGDQPAKKFPGIPSRSPDFLPEDTLITLGKARVSPINMANAYATIAAQGKRADVHVVETVTDASGEELYHVKASEQEVIDRDISADVSYALQQVVENGTGRAALELGRPAAGKTGTATKEDGEGDTYVSSSWFVGYTPQLATAVMYVRGDGDDRIDQWLPSYFGATYPAQTWTAAMAGLMEGLPEEEFPEPVYVDGDAPDEGHEPTPTFTPRPTTRSPQPTTRSPEPTETSEEPTEEPTTPTEEPTTPSEPPTTLPTDPTSTTSSPTGEASPGGGGGGGGSGGSGGPSGSPRLLPSGRPSSSWVV